VASAWLRRELKDGATCTANEEDRTDDSVLTPDPSLAIPSAWRAEPSGPHRGRRPTIATEHNERAPISRGLAIRPWKVAT
jgi:hypothetical protein